jgi:hypothetical protein
VPQEATLKDYVQESYRSLSETNMNGFHGERHTYANERYESLTGEKSPVESHMAHGSEHINYLSEKLSITTEQAIELDKEARLTISQELGHNRIEITNNYLG